MRLTMPRNRPGFPQHFCTEQQFNSLATIFKCFKLHNYYQLHKTACTIVCSPVGSVQSHKTRKAHKDAADLAAKAIQAAKAVEAPVNGTTKRYENMETKRCTNTSDTEKMIP